MRPIARIAACVLAVLVSSAGAHAADRVALVVGNGAYQNVSALPNPSRDAADIAASLARLGFTVTRLTDASANDLRKGLTAFGRAAQGSEMAVVFYAGHGMEVGGENWLIPVDAELRNDTDAENEAVSLKAVTLQVAKARQLGLVILDACRNNPFAAKMTRSLRTRAVVSGLAPTEPTDNVLVAYAAKDGTTANDGDGHNSPFTAALLRNIETPGLEITFLFRNVRDEVMAATKRDQQPFVYGSLSKDAIYLKPAGAPASAAAVAAPPPAVAAAPAPAQDELFWSAVKDSTAPAVFEDFITRFPASARAPEAKSRLETIRTAALGEPRAVPPKAASNANFTDKDIKAVEEAAKRLKLVMPSYEIGEVDPKTPPELSRLVGVWASKVGFNGNGRQFMVIVTSISADGLAKGYSVSGPPTAVSWNQSPAGYLPFTTRIQDGRMTLKGQQLTRNFAWTDKNVVQVRDIWNDGRSATITLEPVWTMAARERAVRR